MTSYKHVANGELVNEAKNESPWGRVDETNTVYVREGESERAIGQYPDGTAEEALAYFTRKFDDLEGQVRLLEQRIAAGSAGADVTQSVAKLAEQLKEPAALGNLAALRERVSKLSEKAEEFSKKQREEREALKKEAYEKREQIVAEAERIAAQPEDQIRWKDSSKLMEGLFTEWQAAQRSGPQISKPQADELWKRFRAARHTFDSARRRFFSQMDATNKAVKQSKEQLIASAEALASQGVAGIPQYRKLLDEWKTVGRASRKIDDQLWAKFKAAGDVLYQAKAEEMAQTNEEYEENLSQKQQLLDEAESIFKIKDHSKARSELTKVQLRWDEIGRVPRESVRSVEQRMRAIEDHVKKSEEDHWAATNPETIARSEGLRGQLEDSIAELSEVIKTAEASGDKKLVTETQEKLKTQQSWLAAIGS